MKLRGVRGSEHSGGVVGRWAGRGGKAGGHWIQRSAGKSLHRAVQWSEWHVVAAAGTGEVGDGPRGSSLPACDGACPRGARTTEIVQSWLEMPPEAERAGNKYPVVFLPPAFLIG